LLAAAKTSTKTKPRSTSAAARAAQRKRVLKQADAARVRRMNRAFVASSDLKPMAKQLLDTRSEAAYKGVEAYAHKHAADDAGGLAYLLLGYARTSDTKPNWDKAISVLKAAKPHAGDLSDYVDYLLGVAYRGKDQPADVVLALDGFGKRHPDSLLTRDAA